MEGRQAALLVTQIKTRCGGGDADGRAREIDGRVFLPFASFVSATGRQHELRYVLVDLALSKSKSSSIVSSSATAQVFLIRGEHAARTN